MKYIFLSMLSGSHVTTAWCVLRLWIEEMAFRCGIQKILDILNKQQRTADRERSSSLGIGRGANNPAPYKILYLTNYLQVPWKWTHSVAQPKRRKMYMRFGTSNVRSLYRAGSLKTVARELGKYKLDLVGVLDVRWEKGGM
jgi:hypothetical protein